ncbi:MAG: efflux RND transporter periplasmic adaptor subunit [Flavisolibacter sp.]
MIFRFHLLSVIATVIFLTSCGDPQASAPKQPPPVPIAVYKVETGNATYYDQFPATVTALNEVQIRPQVTGYVTGIYFKDGQEVKKGMKLYSIDQQQYQAGVDQSIANLNVAKSNLAKAQQDADRYTDLAKKDAIAKQVVDHALADLQAAKMQVAAAQANVRNVQTGLRYSTIYAPMNGTIGISQVKLGTAVTPGVTILNTISSDDPIAVDVNIDEKQIPRFTQMQSKGTNKADSAFQLLLPDGTVYPYPGSIYLIDRAVDPQTGTLKTRLTFPNKNKVLKPGMSMNMRIKNNNSTPLILIPNKGVVEQMGEFFVYVVNGNTVTQKKVVLGNRIGDKIIVKEGLQVNDLIATEGVQKLKDGAKVQIMSGGQTSPATGK